MADAVAGAAAGVVAGDKPSTSALDKPLAELTEEDIAQLTREDCRRFLKDKGMRRPSWNKSQAIQQVISLKALIEGRPGSGDSPAAAGIFVKSPDASTSGDCSQVFAPLASDESGLPESRSPARESCPYRRRDPPAAGGFGPRIPMAGPLDNRYGSQRPFGQMTIFYGGKINVFEGVTQDQTRMIMDVAASSGWSADEATVPIFLRPPVPQFSATFAVPSSATIGKANHGSLDGLDDGDQQDDELEGPTTRKASIQQYLEKKKDRFKVKKVTVGSTPPSMETLYLSRTLRCPNTNEPISGSENSSILPQPQGTPARCNSFDNRSQKIRLSIDLNGDGGEN